VKLCGCIEIPHSPVLLHCASLNMWGQVQVMASSASGNTAASTGKGTHRWPHELRLFMAIQLCSRLTIDEQVAVRDGGIWPSNRSDLTGVYAVVRTAIYKWLVDHGTVVKDLPTVSAIRTAAQRWATKLLRFGHVRDDPPHASGYKMDDARRSVLAQLHDLLPRGYPGPTGWFPFRSVKHAVAVSPRIAGLVNLLDVELPETVWRLLIQEHPDLFKGKWLTKKHRDNEVTRVRAVHLAAGPCTCDAHVFNVDLQS